MKEFNKISVKSLRNEFLFDINDFYKVVKLNQKKYVNFCLIQETESSKANLSFLIHFSDGQIEYKNGDVLYELKFDAPKGIYMLFKIDDTSVYDKKRNEYINGLGKKIDAATGINNTQIISYETEKVIAYFANTLKVISKENNTGNGFLKFSMIRFKEIKESSMNTQYIAKSGKISFTVSAVYEDYLKSVKTTKNLDAGMLEP